MISKLYTIGIGSYLIKGWSVEKRKATFQTRIERLTEQFGTIHIVDIRRYACGSRNGKWCHHPGDQAGVGMQKTLEMPNVKYTQVAALSKPLSFGNTQAEMARYNTWLRERVSTYPAITPQRCGILAVQNLLTMPAAVILMCSEKTALTGNSIKCHRVYVGNIISDRTGCDVIHLPGDSYESTDS